MSPEDIVSCAVKRLALRETKMKIDLGDEQFRALTHKALFDAMSQETRDELVRSAIQTVISGEGGPKHGGYVRLSPLQEIFDKTVSKIAEEIALEMIESNPEYKEKIRSVVVEGFDAIFSGENRAKTVERVSQAVNKGIWGERY